MKLKTVFSVSVLALALCVSFTTHAENLLDVYRQATQSDPVFQSARAQYLSDTEKYPQARALLLPQLSLSEVETDNHTETLSAAVTIPGVTTGTNQFYSNDLNVTLQQTIFNWANFARIGVAKEQVKQAAATYASAAQDLMLRVSKAYFDALFAEDNLRFVEAQKRAIGRQLDQAKQRYNVGLDAVTSVYDAQASYDAIIAQEIAAKNLVVNSRETLRQITGKYYNNLERLKINIPLVTPSPNNIDKWVTAATSQNLDLVAARFAVTAAERNIHVNFAGNLPTVTAQGNVERLRSTDTGVNTIGDRNNETISLQLNLPIYQGGLVLSQTRQAKFDYQKTTANMEDVYRQVMVNTRQTYNNVITGISKIKADKQTILSNQSSVDSTEAALKVGTRTIIDLLQAQQNLLQAQRLLAQDQYQYLQDTLTLKRLAGLLNINDLKKINSWLTREPYPDANAQTDRDNLPDSAASQLNMKTNIAHAVHPSSSSKSKTEEKP